MLIFLKSKLLRSNGWLVLLYSARWYGRSRLPPQVGGCGRIAASGDEHSMVVVCV